jgi:hypothetical protein
MSMEARLIRVVFRTTSLLGLTLAIGGGAPALAAGYKTKNFSVSAPTPQLAKEIGDQAEACRRELAILWLGQELPPWAKPCPIHAKVAPKMGAGGATSFVFDRGEVFGWKMNIQGSRQRILDSVVPHEVTHTIFASHFRRPLPRWADEGACTTVEDRSEVAKQERMLVEFLKTGRGIAFSEMFAMKDYPSDVMPLYSQGHSLAQWLIESRGRKAFLEFLADGMQDDNWSRAVEQHYGFDGLYTMQTAWLDWVKQGRPHLTPETSPIAKLVSNRKSQPSSAALAGQPILRLQSPDDMTRVAATAVEPASSSTADGKVTVASGDSIYAAAAQAKHNRKEAANAAPAKPSAPGPSIYDASLGAGVLRR